MQTLRPASWGRVHDAEQSLFNPRNDEITAWPHPMLGYGLGRSYGDTCLNSSGVLLGSRNRDCILSFDRETGVLRAESGVTLRTLLALCMHPNEDGSHWFLPTSPGTSYVTLAGAVANDVHGKNHHHRGSFGCYVRSFLLLRSDGRKIRCGRLENADLFYATLGGLGLTGLILDVELQMMRVEGLALEVETQRFSHVDQFAALSAESMDWEYNVAWVDCLASEAELGRGLFSRARHVASSTPQALKDARLGVPFTPPFCPLNRFTLKAFNTLYINQIRRTGWVVTRPSMQSYFYPLDAIRGWNRMYGPRGFYQYQCVLPKEGAMQGIEKLLRMIRASGQGSFLAVLKSLGPLQSGGLLSFPMEGMTLALDFPNLGEKTLSLLTALDAITLAHGGRIYPAKDGRVAAETFHRMMPQLNQMQAHIDPAFTSDFWQRMQPHPTGA